MTDARFGRFVFRVTCCHVATYAAAGVVASQLFDYATLFQSEGFAAFMRPLDSRWVAAGPGLQVFRGVLFGVVLFPFRHVFLAEPNGWLKLWGLFLGLAILGTAGPAPGSIEGFIFTTLPPSRQLLGLVEVVVQTLAFSLVLVAAYRTTGRATDIILGIVAALVVGMSVVALFVPR